MRKVTGSYRSYSISSKTAALVPEFVVEDLLLTELQPADGQNTHGDDVL